MAYKQLCSARNLTAIWLLSGRLFDQGISFQYYAAAQPGLFQIYPFVKPMSSSSLDDPCGGVNYIFTQQPVSPWHTQANG